MYTCTYKKHMFCSALQLLTQKLSRRLAVALGHLCLQWFTSPFPAGVCSQGGLLRLLMWWHLCQTPLTSLIPLSPELSRLSRFRVCFDIFFAFNTGNTFLTLLLVLFSTDAVSLHTSCPLSWFLTGFSTIKAQTTDMIFSLLFHTNMAKGNNSTMFVWSSCLIFLLKFL